VPEPQDELALEPCDHCGAFVPPSQLAPQAHLVVCSECSRLRRSEAGVPAWERADVAERPLAAFFETVGGALRRPSRFHAHLQARRSIGWPLAFAALVGLATGLVPAIEDLGRLLWDASSGGPPVAAAEVWGLAEWLLIGPVFSMTWLLCSALVLHLGLRLVRAPVRTLGWTVRALAYAAPWGVLSLGTAGELGGWLVANLAGFGAVGAVHDVGIGRVVLSQISLGLVLLACAAVLGALTGQLSFGT
jgi:hypothetical protein